jgi:hypothetical protein
VRASAGSGRRPQPCGTNTTRELGCPISYKDPFTTREQLGTTSYYEPLEQRHVRCAEEGTCV